MLRYNDRLDMARNLLDDSDPGFAVGDNGSRNTSYMSYGGLREKIVDRLK